MRVWAAFVTSATLIATTACERLPSLPSSQQAADGAYVIIEVDTDSAVDEQLEGLSEQIATTLRASSIQYSGRGVADQTLRIRLSDPAEVRRAREAIGPITGHLTLVELPEGVIEGRVSEAYVQTLRDQTALEAIGVLQRRLQRAVVEPYGSGRLIIKTSQSFVTDELLLAATKRGLITFHTVHETSSRSDRPPIGATLAPAYFQDGLPEIVRARPNITGHITRAGPSADAGTGQFVVSFEFDAEGARAFCSITRQNVGKRFAILFDGAVLTAPMVNEPICGGSGQISGTFTAESAGELATYMRAGPLPASFMVIHQGVGVPPAP
jgi:preprotein translocase subunit SecD